MSAEDMRKQNAPPDLKVIEETDGQISHLLSLDPAVILVTGDHGINADKLAFLMDLKNNRRGRIKEYAEEYKGVTYTPVNPDLDYNP